MIRKIKKSMDKAEYEMTKNMYSTLVGSIVSVVGMLKGKTPAENYKYFKKLKKELTQKEASVNTVVKIIDYVDKHYGDMPLLPCFKARAVLVWATNSFWAPMVALSNEDGKIFPISPDGMYYGILAQIGREEVIIEPIYGEDE